MTDLPALITGARAELGLPALPPLAPAAPSLPPPVAVAPIRTLTGALLPPRTLPATVASTQASLDLTPHFDSIHETVRSLGSTLRPSSAVLEDVANGTTQVLSSDQSRAAAGSRESANTLLSAMYVDAAQHGEANMPRAPRTLGNKVDLLVRNANYLPRLYEDLDGARKSITINQFNWEPDGSGKVVADVLHRKAASGLDVRVLVDGYGIGEKGGDVADALQTRLEAVGVRFVRTGGFKLGGTGFEHRKLITIDDDIAYTGGLGFGAKYDSWTDMMVRVQGPAAAVAAATSLATMSTHGLSTQARLRQIHQTLKTGAQAAADGMRTLTGAGGAGGGAGGGSVGAADARAAVTILDNRPSQDLAATEAFLRDTATAKHRLWATSTYITTPIAVNALIEAAKRGVDVKLLMTAPSAGNDSKQIYLGRTMYDEMIDAGVELFEWPGILHGKSWVKDDDVAAVGSMNLSRSSMARARELVARVEDPAFAQTYADFHTETRAGAHQVTRDEVGGLAMDALGLLGKVGIEF
ncbi:MAG: putative phospholipase d/transphosphatidylase [Thermoleophilia bacterium]|nr:putative phospholipase d/transphosphatidylase [Thermoleophilia bacterium]